MIVNLGETEKAAIVKESQALMKDLCAFRDELCLSAVSK